LNKCLYIFIFCVLLQRGDINQETDRITLRNFNAAIQSPKFLFRKSSARKNQLTFFFSVFLRLQVSRNDVAVTCLVLQEGQSALNRSINNFKLRY
ncbi:unnamed protein product, partial [Ixodes pacificus]